MNNEKVFVLDTYQKYKNKDKLRSIFSINGRWYGIYECDLIWGKPNLNTIDDEYFNYTYYYTLEEAQKAVHKMKQGESIPI